MVPPNAAVDPRLRAAFQAFASHGAAKGLTERGTRGGGDGMASRQFQRACAAAGLPLESGAVDVVFASHVTGRGRTLSFQRFLEALAQASALYSTKRWWKKRRGRCWHNIASAAAWGEEQARVNSRCCCRKHCQHLNAAHVCIPPQAMQVAQESGMVLEEVLEAVRCSAPTGSPGPTAAAAGATSPGANPKPSPRASPRPKSAAASCKAGPGRALQQEAGAAGPLELEVATGSPGNPVGPSSAAPQLNKLQQSVMTLQQLLEQGPEGEEGIPAHLGKAAPPALGGVSCAQQAQQQGDRLLLNPAFQVLLRGGCGMGREEDRRANDWPRPRHHLQSCRLRLLPPKQESLAATLCAPSTPSPPLQGPEGGADLAAFRLQMLALLDQRCEATEHSCAALVATRADMAQALSQVSATLGGGTAAAAAAAEAKEALAAVRGLQAQLSAMDSRLSGAVRQAQETRAAVSVLEAQVEALQRSQDAALRQTNEAILCIARRVGALAVPGPTQQQQQQQAS